MEPPDVIPNFKFEAKCILFASIIVWAAICFRLGDLPLEQPDEGRNAEVAREMKESGAWLVPTYNGMAYLDKPSFYFKAVAISLAVFGDSETAARIPSAAFGIALVILVYIFCRREYGVRCAALAAVVLATTPLPRECAHSNLRYCTLLLYGIGYFCRLSGRRIRGKFAAFMVSGQCGRRRFCNPGKRAGRLSCSGTGSVAFSPCSGAARRVEAFFCASEPAGFFRRGSAMVYRTFIGT